MRRLTPVRIPLVAALLVVVAAFPAGAQSDAAQTGPTLEASVGLGGFVASDRPTTVRATISSPILVAGRLRVRGAGVSVSRPVEVPAGGEQVYELTVPNMGDGTRLTVEILDPDGDPIVSEAVVMRSNLDELAVGVLGDDGLVETLGRVRTIVTDRPVAPIAVPPDASPAVFDVLGYLVVTRAASDRAADAINWAAGGGHVVIDASVSEASDLPATPMPTGLGGVTAAPHGSGRVVLVTDLESRDGDDWAAILRPTPLDIASSAEFGMIDQGGGLFQAATESGSRQVPSLPWLLFALLGFALVVGPINFIVLSKLQKRDWAWLTIPALALLAVTAFWVAGRQRIAGTNLTHASVIVADGTIEARSAVIVAAGTAGERRVSIGPESAVFPERNTMTGSTAELRLDGESTALLDLDQLGYAGVGLLSRPSDLAVPTVTADGDVIRVENATDLHFWGWGAIRGATAVVSQSELEVGVSGEVARPARANQFGFGFIDALMNQHQLWEDPERSNALWSLGTVVSASIEDGATYFIGLTDDYQPQVSVSDAADTVPGPTVVLVRLSGTDDGGRGATTAGAAVVGTGFVSWVDWQAQHVIATDELTVSFNLPDPGRAVRFVHQGQWGMAQQYLAWDWAGSEFVEIQPNDDLPSGIVSQDGQVFVRLVGSEFGENPFSPDEMTLEWDNI